MNNGEIADVESHKHLGVTFESSGSWNKLYTANCCESIAENSYHVET